MMREVVRALETGVLAEIGLLAFFLAFCLIVAYAVWLPRDAAEAARHLPLED